MLWRVQFMRNVSAICFEHSNNPTTAIPSPSLPSLSKASLLSKTSLFVKNKVSGEDVASGRCIVGHEPREFDASSGKKLL